MNDNAFPESDYMNETPKLPPGEFRKLPIEEQRKRLSEQANGAVIAGLYSATDPHDGFGDKVRGDMVEEAKDFLETWGLMKSSPDERGAVIEATLAKHLENVLTHAEMVDRKWTECLELLGRRQAERDALQARIDGAVKATVGFRDGKPAVFFTDETNEHRFERIRLKPVLILPAA